MQIEVTNQVSSGWWDSDDPDTKPVPKIPVSPAKRRKAHPLPEFEFPLRSPSIFPSSPCETLFSESSRARTPEKSAPPNFDHPNSVTDVDSVYPRTSEVPDDSFWATSAALLGPDFDLNSRSLVERVEANRPGRESKYRNMAVGNDTSSPTTMPIIPQELIISLESLGMSWKWFTDQDDVQNYISNRIPHAEAWDFGVCLAHEDGRLQCLVMHAQGPVRTYSEPALFGGVQLDANMVVSGTKSIFWWCRPHPQWSEANRGRWARNKKMDTQYAFAKQNIAAFRALDSPETRFALRQSRQDLLKDLVARERGTGRYSVPTMNTVLQLSTINEQLSFFDEADSWALDLIKRRTVRTGVNSEHTCAARYKHAQLLLRMGRYEDAQKTAARNIEGLLDLSPSHTLVTKQNIQNCAIACKRRKYDQALEVVEHFWTIERLHPNDRALKESALEVLVETHISRKEFDRAEEYLRKQLALYDTTYGYKAALGRLYYLLASTLASQFKHNEVLRELRKCAAVYKDIKLEYHDEEFISLCILQAETLMELKEWAKARLCWEKVSHGALVTFGKDDERAVMARTKLEVMDERAKVKAKGGLAERLLKFRDKERDREKGKEQVLT